MFRDNIEGTVDYFANYIYPHPALQPEYTRLAANISSIPLLAPKIHFIRNGRVYVTLDKITTSRLVNQIAIYKSIANEWSLFNVLPIDGDGEATNKNVGLKLEKGSYVATFIDRFGLESPKNYFEV